MPPRDPPDFNELLLFRVNLDVPAFVQTAVRHKMNRDEILVYLGLIANTPTATEKIWRLNRVAQDKVLSRERDSRVAARLIWRFDGSETYQPENYRCRHTLRSRHSLP